MRTTKKFNQFMKLIILAQITSPKKESQKKLYLEALEIHKKKPLKGVYPFPGKIHTYFIKDYGVVSFNEEEETVWEDEVIKKFMTKKDFSYYTTESLMNYIYKKNSFKIPFKLRKGDK